VNRGSGRPTKGYFTADGTRVPSVTTINSFGGDSGGLVYKAKKNWHEAGRLGHPFERDAYWPDDTALWGTDAKETGSIVHAWIENDIHGDPLADFPDASSVQLEQAGQAFLAYRDWRTMVDLEIVDTELPLVSEKHGFGGTLDAIAVLNNRRVLLDWKASNSARVSYIAQLAAYRVLVNENNYGPVENAYLLRVGKTHGDFHLHSYPAGVLDTGWQWFLAAKTQYELDKTLAKVAS